MPTTRAASAKSDPVILSSLSCALGRNRRTIAPMIGKNVARLMPPPLSNHSILGQPPLEDHERCNEDRYRSEEHRCVALDIPTLDVSEEPAGRPGKPRR